MARSTFAIIYARSFIIASSASGFSVWRWWWRRPNPFDWPFSTRWKNKVAVEHGTLIAPAGAITKLASLSTVGAQQADPTLARDRRLILGCTYFYKVSTTKLLHNELHWPGAINPELNSYFHGTNLKNLTGYLSAIHIRIKKFLLDERNMFSRKTFRIL